MCIIVNVVEFCFRELVEMNVKATSIYGAGLKILPKIETFETKEKLKMSSSLSSVRT